MQNEVAEIERATSDGASREQLLLIANSVPLLVSYVDRERRYWFVNATYDEWFGVDRADVEGRTMAEVLGDEAFRTIAPHVDAALAGERVHYEARVTYRTVGTRFIEATYVPHVTPEGVAGFVAIVADATHRQRLQHRLQVLAEAGLRLSQHLDPDATMAAVADVVVAAGIADFCVVDLVDRKTKELRRVVAVHRDPARQPLLDVLARHAPLRDGNPVVQAVRSGRTMRGGPFPEQLAEAASSSDDQTRAIVALDVTGFVIVPLRTTGEPFGALSFGTSDESAVYDDELVELAEELARRCALALENATRFAEEQHLRRARETVAAQLELMQSIALALARARTVDEACEATIEPVASHLGASAAGVVLRVGERLRTIAARGTPDEIVARHGDLPVDGDGPVREAVRTGEALYVEGRAASHDERSAARSSDVEALAVVPLRASGEVLGALGLRFAHPRRFTTDQRELLERIADQCAQAIERARLFEAERIAREEADAASRAKDQFLAMLGHELRNPLAPIATAVHLLRMRGFAEGNREMAIIARQVDHLSRLVDDLLDVSRITRGEVGLRREPVSLSAIVAEALETSSALFEQKHQHLHVDLPESGTVVDGDPVRLVQVVSNLLVNAAKYTLVGGHVDVRVAHDGDLVVLSVRDDGIGIEPALLDRIFDPFAQAPQALERAKGGLGLGLAITKRLVVMHGGTVAARSEGAGHGTEFVVRLPAFASARLPTPAPPERTSGPPRRRVLVVDDNRDLAELQAAWLALDGHEVELAHNGPEALEAAARFAPDVVLLDIGLPVMDGYEVASRLRSAATGPLRLVAVTGYGQASDRARTAAAGFDSHLVKPVDPETLRGIIA